MSMVLLAGRAVSSSGEEVSIYGLDAADLRSCRKRHVRRLSCRQVFGRARLICVRDLLNRSVFRRCPSLCLRRLRCREVSAGVRRSCVQDLPERQVHE